MYLGSLLVAAAEGACHDHTAAFGFDHTGSPCHLDWLKRQENGDNSLRRGGGGAGGWTP